MATIKALRDQYEALDREITAGRRRGGGQFESAGVRL